MQTHLLSKHPIGSVRFCGLCGFALSLRVAVGIVPEAQHVGNQMPPVVQVIGAAVVGNTVGTGAVIDKWTAGKDEHGNDLGWFCVLTCDHVVARGGIAIGFGDGNPAADGVFPILNPVRRYPLQRVGKIQCRADLAIVLVFYGPVNAFFNGIVPRARAAVANPVDRQFTEAGYGLTGLPLPNFLLQQIGYFQIGGLDFIKRFQNNVVTALNLNAMIGGYCYDSIRWDLDDPGVAGEGAAYQADSGGPYFISDQVNIMVNGVNIAAFRDQILGVNTYGVRFDWPILGRVTLFSPHFTSEHGGVFLQAVYRAWINAQCALLKAVTEDAATAQLSIAHTPGNVTLSWQQEYQDFRLQAAMSPTGPWTEVPNTGSVASVTLPVTGARQFFRLNLPEADLAIATSASPTNVTVGQNVLYTITVTNPSNVTVTGVTLSDLLPDGVILRSAEGGDLLWTDDENGVMCQTNTLPPGGVGTMQVLIAPFQSGPLTNATAALAQEPDPNLSNNVTQLVISVNPLPAATCLDFNSGTPTNATLFGSAFVDTAGGVSNSGVLKLTVAATNQVGSMILGDLNGGLPVRQFTATFKAFVGGGTTVPGDGFSFNFASDLPSTAFGEQGAGTGLTVAFVSFDTTGGTNAPAINVKQGGTTIAQTPVPIVSTGPYGTNFFDVFVQLNADSSLDVVYGGAVIYTNLPTGYVATTGRFGLGASTTNSTDNHWIDDLCIAPSP